MDKIKMLELMIWENIAPIKIKVPAGSFKRFSTVRYVKSADCIEIPSCDHEFVNVGFSSIKMVCKKCDLEQV